jgi:TPR repeat protein
MVLCYERRLAAKQDYINAVKWYENAAEKGHICANYKLAEYYEKGHGVEKHSITLYNRTRKGFQSEAQIGDTDAKFEIGICYEYGKRVTKNKEKAAK